MPSAQPQTHLPALHSPMLAIIPAAALHRPAPPFRLGRARHELPEPCSAWRGSPQLIPTTASGMYGEPGGGGDAGTPPEGLSRGVHPAPSTLCRLISLGLFPGTIFPRRVRGFRKFLLLSKSLLIFLVKASASLLPPSSLFFLIHIRFKLRWLHS